MFVESSILEASMTEATLPEIPDAHHVSDGMLAVLLYQAGRYHYHVTQLTKHWQPRLGDISLAGELSENQSFP